MPSYITAQEVFALYPHLPSTLKTYFTRSVSITFLDGIQNVVFLIDNVYILRTRKIQLYEFDDIGGCSNFKAAVDHIDKYHFKFHPNYLVLQQSKGPSGELTEFLLYKQFPGQSLDIILSTLSKSEIYNTAKQVASIMYELHQIPAPYYGFFSGQRFDSWNAFINYWIDKQSIYIQKNKTLSDEEISKVRFLFKKHNSLFTLLHPSTIHLDFSSSNILVDNRGNVNCIIDWDNARGGDPIIDVSYALERGYKTKNLSIFVDYFLDEYLKHSGENNRREFMLKYRLYSLFYAYKLLPVHTAHISNPRENVNDLTRYIRKILMLLL